MFVLEFENPLFEFAYERPQSDLLFALPPTFSSSMVYHLFTVPLAAVELDAHEWDCLVVICIGLCIYCEIPEYVKERIPALLGINLCD